MKLATANNASALPENPNPESADRVKLRVAAYWQRLGLTDAELIERLVDECLSRARRVIVHGSEDELLRRSLEEVQRRLDHALAQSLDLPPSQDTRPLAALRAAFLLSGQRSSADALFRPGPPARPLGEAIRHALPQPTPPEAPLSMTEAPLRFWLFRSAAH
jgi:hypothetical protein